jgi:hypothetical protein
VRRRTSYVMCQGSELGRVVLPSASFLSAPLNAHPVFLMHGLAIIALVTKPIRVLSTLGMVLE